MRHILALTAFALIACFLLHVIEFDHQHPASFGHGIQAALHGDDKKRFVLLALLYIWVFLVTGASHYAYGLRDISWLRAGTRSIYGRHSLFDPIRMALRRGIVHPKLCG